MHSPDIGRPTRHALPLTEALGRVHRGSRSGLLTVTAEDEQTPSFAFWFKRGYPCFSWSRDGVARFGQQLSLGQRQAAEPLLRAPDPTGRIIGQRLLAASMITLEEIQSALASQMNRRFLDCSALADCTWVFQEGPEHLTGVPLSSPVLNTIEVGMASVGTADLLTLQSYVCLKVTSPRIRLKEDRILPPRLRSAFPEGMLELLEEGTDAIELTCAPARLRLLAFLAAFGYLQADQGAPREQDAGSGRSATRHGPGHGTSHGSSRHEARFPAHPTDSGLGALLHAAREQASWYELLGIPFVADRETVKRRYREMAFQIHPDRLHPSQREPAREVFALLVEAYRTLSKDRLRVPYDQELVSSGRITRLGNPDELSFWLAQREATLQQDGLGHLAGEYRRMLQWMYPISRLEPEFRRQQESV
jgi:hypothetical protein